MNDYIAHIFQQYVLKTSSKEFNTLVKPQLLKLKPVQLTTIYKQLTTSPLLFNELNLLIVKGLIKYSPANCTLQLSLPNLMLYQRLQKVIAFSRKSLHPLIAQFVNEWIQQGLQNNGLGYPILFQKSLISKEIQNINNEDRKITNKQGQKKTNTSGKIKQTSNALEKTSNTKIKQGENYDYHRLVYEYQASENLTNNQQLQKITNINQQKPKDIDLNLDSQKQGKSKSKGKQSKKNNKKKDQQSQQQEKQKSKPKQQQPLHSIPQQQFDQYMLNVQELTRLLQSQTALNIINSRLSQKQKKITLFEFLQHKDRQSIIQQLRWQKKEEYIAQLLGQDCLLVFNLIKKYPYLTEKELIKLTLLEVLQTRQALNKLLQKGWVYFYHENARTIVYKIGDPGILYQSMMDSISKSIVNLTLAMERLSKMGVYSKNLGSEEIKHKLIKLQCEIQRLDDILLLFGY